MRRIGLVALSLGGLAGCLRSTQFACERDADCNGGTCEPIGFCAFADGSCPSGVRFGDFAGALSNTCVGAAGDDAGVADAPPDGPADAALPPDAFVCPAAYVAVTGATNRYRRETNTASWEAHRASCAADGGYLMIPDSAAELAALAALDNDAVFWVGITDQAAENTFLTSLGAPAPFLPWAAGEPDDKPNPNADCVRTESGIAIADDRCSSGRDAICECGPP